MYEKFNRPDTLGIISSYPAKNGEVASENAIARYTHVLTTNFPKSQNVIVFSEKRNLTKPYLASENILVVPTYKPNSVNFLTDLSGQVAKYNFVKDYLIQYEFSIFGGKIIIPQFLSLLVFLKVCGKSTKLMFHQVVNDINTLSGHLAIKKGSMKAHTLNLLMRLFYIGCGIFSDKILVHDNLLLERIKNFVDSRKVVIIPHGMTYEKPFTQVYKNLSKKYFGVNKNTKLIGLFGYCSWYKGTDWLIENFSEFKKKNPQLDVKLLVAGGQSPTLKGTYAYKKYHERLKSVIRKANGSILYTGFVPEKDVKRVFAAADLFIFPYRTKMSASGAFSLCQGFGKPYLVSSAFAANLSVNEKAGRTFPLTFNYFDKILMKALTGESLPFQISSDRSWNRVALLYIEECLSDPSYVSKLNYAQAY